jgi:transcriptional regulator with XRE-family HTH domain
LGLTQGELVERLGLEEEFDQERISKFERGKLKPPMTLQEERLSWLPGKGQFTAERSILILMKRTGLKP